MSIAQELVKIGRPSAAFSPNQTGLDPTAAPPRMCLLAPHQLSCLFQRTFMSFSNCWGPLLHMDHMVRLHQWWAQRDHLLFDSYWAAANQHPQAGHWRYNSHWCSYTGSKLRTQMQILSQKLRKHIIRLNIGLPVCHSCIIGSVRGICCVIQKLHLFMVNWSLPRRGKNQAQSPSRKTLPIFYENVLTVLTRLCIWENKEGGFCHCKLLRRKRFKIIQYSWNQEIGLFLLKHHCLYY